jgi:hypothetical protein
MVHGIYAELIVLSYRNKNVFSGGDKTVSIMWMTPISARLAVMMTWLLLTIILQF